MQIKLSGMDDLYFTHFSLIHQYEGFLRVKELHTASIRYYVILAVIKTFVLSNAALHALEGVGDHNLS